MSEAPQKKSNGRKILDFATNYFVMAGISSIVGSGFYYNATKDNDQALVRQNEQRMALDSTVNALKLNDSDTLYKEVQNFSQRTNYKTGEVVSTYKSSMVVENTSLIDGSDPMTTRYITVAEEKQNIQDIEKCEHRQDIGNGVIAGLLSMMTLIILSFGKNLNDLGKKATAPQARLE